MRDRDDQRLHTGNLPPVNWGAAARADVYNSSGTVLFWDSWSSYPIASRTIPNSNYYSAPYRGTRGPTGLPSDVVIKSTARRNLVTLTISKSPRPNFNTGSMSAAQATFVGNFPTTVYASMQPSETGQHFKVRVAAGGRIRVTGTAQASS